MTLVQPGELEELVLSRPAMEFARFYSTTLPAVHRAALRVAAGDRELAWDAVQEAYARLWTRWGEREQRAIEENRRYATKIAINQVIDMYRHRRTVVGLPDHYDVCVLDSALDEVDAYVSEIRLAREIIDRQPVRRRAVAVLFFLEHFTTAEIAAALGMTPSTVRTQIERTRRELLPCITRNGDSKDRG